MRITAARAVWATACAALLLWSVAALIAGSVQGSHYHHDQQQAATATHFYRVIAGKDDAGIHVNDALATDLRKTPKSALPEFQGTSNQYGGITSEIGVNPFDNTCGIECGHLTGPMLSNVERARDGHPVSVTAAKHTTSATLPLILFIAVFVLGIAAESSRRITRTLRKTRTQQSLRRDYPDECRTLDRLQAAMDALASRRMTPREGDQYDELRRMHDGIESALKMRIDPAVADDHLTEARTEKLMQEARATLSAVDAGNRYLEQ